MTLADLLIILDLYAGPGGWDVALRQLGLLDALHALLGLEWDPSACATREAAGHRTERVDVSQFEITPELARAVCALIGSPPCTTFAQSGERAGNMIRALLATLIRDLIRGRDTRMEHRMVMGAELERAGWPGPRTPEGKRAAKVTAAVASAVQVAEPARYIHACRPAWVALEQVPSVQPLWDEYAAEMTRIGYSVWTGKLNAADYGAPQSRVRAVLIASREHPVHAPERTHFPAGQVPLWGETHRSMADAIGWGCTGRPSYAVTAGGSSTGGAEAYGGGARQCMARERAAGRWAERPGGVTHVRLDAREAGVLQGFPASYPWQGTKTKQQEQAGNAVPVPLARAVLAVASASPSVRRAAA